jgi:hypothetical protein
VRDVRVAADQIGIVAADQIVAALFAKSSLESWLRIKLWRLSSRSLPWNRGCGSNCGGSLREVFLAIVAADENEIPNPTELSLGTRKISGRDLAQSCEED